MTVNCRKITLCCKTHQTHWRLVSYAPGDQMPYHEHTYAQFSLILAGSFQELNKAGNSCFQSNSVDAKPVNFVHANKFGSEGALLLSINFLQDPKDENGKPLIDRWKMSSLSSCLRDWNLLLYELMSLSSNNTRRIEEITNDLLINFDRDNDMMRKTPPIWLARAKEALCETEDTAVQIAEREGVHRVHLVRSFRKYYGISISQFRRQHRTMKAISLIARGNTSLANVATRVGFFDQSHLNRSMREIIRLTPGNIRALFS